MSAPSPSTAAVSYDRRIGLFSGTMLVVGGIIGSGIFLNPAIVAQRVGTTGLTMAVWALGALVAILGAFIFAELGARSPTAGGGYAYLRDAFGPLPAFLYGWALLVAIASGAIAAVAVTFASYFAPLVGLGPNAHVPLAVGAVVLLSLVNAVGVRPGAVTQNVFTILKLAAIAALVVGGLVAAGAGSADAAAVATAAGAPPRGGAPSVIAVGTALVPVLFSYGGWQQTNFVAEEMVEPERTLPRALVIGVLVVAAVYLAVNATYLRVLGVDGLAASSAPAADAMGAAFGPAGRTLIAAGISISTFGFLNLVILVTPRVYQAMARDGLFFRRLAELHPRYRTPVAAVAIQGVWAVVLVMSGSYGQLLDYVTFADWIFFGVTATALLVFRRRDPVGDGTRFRAPLYPWSVIVFVLASAYVVTGAVVSNPGNAVRGTLLLAAGVPAYLYWRSRASGSPGRAIDVP
ncbi:MAG TPA: amino acid permease [Gemmatimonadaceae bacterium]|nr:amino acid permease [Gemmatimonadaceae bacterium]